MSESELQRAVLDVARIFQWRVAHFRPAQNRRGQWQTAVAADGAGFVDLVLVHPEMGVLFVELKAAKGKLSEAQQAWGDALTAAGARWYCWRPDDWPQIAATLSGGRAAA